MVSVCALVYLDMLMNLKAKNSFVYIGFLCSMQMDAIDGLLPPSVYCFLYRTVCVNLKIVSLLWGKGL